MQIVRQLRAIGNLCLNLQEMRHEIHDPDRNRNHKEAQQSQDDPTPMPFVSCNFIHVSFSFRD